MEVKTDGETDVKAHLVLRGKMVIQVLDYRMDLNIYVGFMPESTDCWNLSNSLIYHILYLIHQIWHLYYFIKYYDNLQS